ncbi:hypothetical protein M409DRAFT_52448 [Zasmidium cellare ATCC 36951]|uniref:MYND-type domain-containing protein n=1 Tax=Zasmidium cellare ATCC 36951 TaxID=1080233 RepID=A0A6A6CPG0_ZASCE|nr:uncharacterized protein M409DRAFT_52448 [Zasmidium cellare ATCC 36951]KAF2169167.1 hypothetical protein M409DRAFT_52448 [Zasmidium cellare ATCC 36951]
MARPGFSKTILLTATPGEKPVNGIKCIPIDFEVIWMPKDSRPELLDWKVSQISVKLGVPVRATRRPVYPPVPDPPFNNRVPPLFMKSDMDDPDFGASGHISWLQGDFAVQRCDKKDLEVDQLAALLQYISGNFVIASSWEFPKFPKDVQNSIKAEISKKVNPTAFAAWFEDRRLQMIAEGHKVWKDLPCPVVFDGCAACGERGKDGQELQLCAGCKEARYCTKACQKAHWKQHKKACKEAAHHRKAHLHRTLQLVLNL